MTYDRIGILISAPSLDTKRNVSGISSVVRMIIAYTPEQYSFLHLTIGAQDNKRGLAKVLDTLASILRASAQIMAGSFEIFHCNMALNTKSILRDSAMLLIAKARGKRVLLHIHGGQYMSQAPSRWLRNYVSWSLSKADRILVLSKLERDALAEFYSAPHGNVYPLYNFVDTSIVLKKKNGSGNAVKFVFAGRLVEEKGIADIIEAIDKTRGSGHLRFEFHGRGPLEAQIKALAARDERVHFNGVFDANSSRETLAQYDILLLPSRNGEGMPMAMIEAMSVGVVPICTPISSVPEVIEDYRNGVLVPPNAPTRIAEAMIMLANDEELRRAISHNAWQYSQQHFSAKRNCKSLAGHYAAMLGPVGNGLPQTSGDD
jgi:glycosyltransferase involved in cell wall biosynthesis